MPNPKGANARVLLVVFAENAKIEKSKLDRAIGGGMKRAGLCFGAHQVREEVISTTHFKLASHFASGGTLEGKLSSLAFKIAYRVTIDTFRRPGSFDRLWNSTIEVTDARPAVEMQGYDGNGEEQILRKARLALRAKVLASAVREISRSDREVLIEMLQRSEMLPRETEAERRFANAVAQREKRARDRLTALVQGSPENER